MKKLAAILLLLLLLFNLVGYKLLFYYAQQKADAHLIASLDRNRYSKSDLITIKIPLSMPYLLEQTEFERVDGEISLEGIIYKYVERKVQNGALVLLCLPDHNKARLQTERDNFFKSANSLQANDAPVKKQADSKTISLANILSEYDSQAQQWLLQELEKRSNHACRCTEPDYTTQPSRPLEQPPETRMV